MFLLFSLVEFQNNILSIADADDFGNTYVIKLIVWFCDEVTFTAQFPEEMGNTFTASNWLQKRT